MLVRSLSRIQLRAFSKLYSETHEWVEKENGNIYKFGISRKALDQLGGVVFLEFPEIGKSFKRGDKIGEVESPKAVSDVYSPADITVISNNDDLVDDISKINELDELKWISKIKIEQNMDGIGLVSEEEYLKSNSE